MALTALETNEGILVRQSDANATASNDVLAGPATLRHVTVDNGGHADDAFLKFYDSSLPTVGADEPVEVIHVPGSGGSNGGHLSIPINPPDGLSFENGLSFACVKNVGATDGPGKSGTTDPSGTVTVALFTSEGA